MIEKYNYEGDTSIGFFATVTDEQMILPPDWKRTDFFEGDQAETFIARTRLVGLYTAGNSNCILVPRNTTEHERGKLEQSEVTFEVLQTRENALGNLILANDKGVVISPKLEHCKEQIEDALEVDAVVSTVAGLPNPGVCGVANNQGVVLHREANEEEAERIKEALDVENIDIGTINMGSPYIGSGALATNENVLVGEDSTGPEIGRLDQMLHVE